MSEINPEIIQIGNEIDNGFMLPQGNITNQDQFLALLSQGISAVRNSNSATKIMIHKAVPSSAVWFFNIVNSLDYDYIGLSYYPNWHGKNLDTLKTPLTNVSKTFDKELILAETSYPFTLDGNDQTNNVMGSNSQILYPDFTASLNGQKEFLTEIKSIVKSIPNGIGLAYWGAEWVAYDGPTSTKGSSWENQALFDYNFKATPAIEVFKEK